MNTKHYNVLLCLLFVLYISVDNSSSKSFYYHTIILKQETTIGE